MIIAFEIAEQIYEKMLADQSMPAGATFCCDSGGPETESSFFLLPKESNTRYKERVRYLRQPKTNGGNHATNWKGNVKKSIYDNR